jgi:hypothetical protein
MLRETSLYEHPGQFVLLWALLVCLYVFAYAVVPYFRRSWKSSQVHIETNLYRIAQDVIHTCFHTLLAETLLATIGLVAFHAKAVHCLYHPLFPVTDNIYRLAGCSTTETVWLHCLAAVISTEVLAVGLAALVHPWIAHIALDSKRRLPIQLFKSLGIPLTCLLFWVPRYAPFFVIPGLNAQHALFVCVFTHAVSGFKYTYADKIRHGVMFNLDMSTKKVASDG